MVLHISLPIEYPYNHIFSNISGSKYQWQRRKFKTAWAELRAKTAPPPISTWDAVVCITRQLHHFVTGGQFVISPTRENPISAQWDGDGRKIWRKKKNWSGRLLVHPLFWPQEVFARLRPQSKSKPWIFENKTLYIDITWSILKSL